MLTEAPVLAKGLDQRVANGGAGDAVGDKGISGDVDSDAYDDGNKRLGIHGGVSCGRTPLISNEKSLFITSIIHQYVNIPNHEK